MLQAIDIRLPSSPRLEAVRRGEYIALLLLAAASVVLLPSQAIFFAAPFILLALVIVPGKPVVSSSSRTELMLTKLTELESTGMALRAQIVAAQAENDDAVSAVVRSSLDGDVVGWMSTCCTTLRPYPEVGIIVESLRERSHAQDLDEYLLTISRLRRLVRLSRVLELPL